MTPPHPSDEIFQFAVEAAPIGMVLIDRTGRMIFVNHHVEKLFGYRREELIGQPEEFLLPPRFRSEIPQTRANYFENPQTRSLGAGREIFGLRKDGREFPVEIGLTPLQTRLGMLVLAAINDLTERRRQQEEQALRRALGELEERVQKRTAELARSNAELEQFAYIASHDLQEPLRKIQAFGALLTASADATLDDKGRMYVERMRDAAQRLQLLVNDLLEFARVTFQGRPFVAVDLARVAREVVSDLENRISITGGRVEIGELPSLEGDPMQVRQLLQNLIGNALKFHRVGVPPIVVVRSCSLVNGDARQCEITVQDNGIGFEEKYRDRIFAPFQRLHGRSEYEGTGMGLAICRKIVERHGGAITASSTPGQGSTFLVTLPLQHARGEATTRGFQGP
jgi:PAS domain S-box-containing protein